MTTTSYLGLTTYDTASGSFTKFLDYRLSVAGLSSNMQIIDNYASSSSGSIASLLVNSVHRVVATWVSTNYYESIVSGLTSYISGNKFLVTFNVANTGAATININALGAVSISKISASSGSKISLSSGDLKINKYYSFVYDGSSFVLADSTTSDQVNVSGGSSGHYLRTSASGVIEDSDVAMLTGITAGSYNRVGFDVYGRAISGSLITLSPYTDPYIISGSSAVLTNAKGLTAGSGITFTTGGSVLNVNVSLSGSGVMSNTTGSVVKHNTSGITSGSYNRIGVDNLGHAVSGSLVGMSGSLTFYTAGSSGSICNTLNTIVIENGFIISWAQV